jgi:hypothetical protein
MSQPQIQSGWWQSPAGSPLTPTGAAKVSEIDNPYITKDEYIESPEAFGAGITATSPDGLYQSGMLDKIILRASSFVNRFCRRWFDTQTIDEIHTGFTVKPFNPRLVTVVCRNAPLQAINSIYIQVLQWFIQVQTTPLQGSYLQIQPDWGTYKIVPLLSTAGSGTGSPIPAEILDKVPLGVLWTNYTFGFGQVVTGYTLSNIANQPGQYTTYQAKDYNYRLWAPSQPVNVYVGPTLALPSAYSIDYPNGIVTFSSDLGSPAVVTTDFTTNNTLPYDIKYAVIKIVTKQILQGMQNPMGFTSMNIAGYSVSYGDEYMKEIKEILAPYKRNAITII